MIKTISYFLLYNEKRTLIQKNVLLITKVALLQALLAIYYVWQGNVAAVIYDCAILVLIAYIWWSVKYRGVYLSNLIFLIVVPLFSWIIFDSLQHGIINVIWSFPIIAALFFCFYKYVAWLATAIIVTVTTLCCMHYFSYESTFRVFIALLMVSFCFVASFSNVYSHYEQLEDKASRDPLTGLRNRSLLNETVISSTKKKSPFLSPILVYIDLDNFKYINDSFGHIQGDQVLVTTANILSFKQRSNISVFRVGGEEFLLLLENMHLEQAHILAESLRTRIQATDMLENHTVTASIGISVYKENEHWETWMKRADKAMYQAKTTGKNKIVVAE